MTLSIGKEKVGDGTEIIEMLIKAFEDVEYSDKKEHELVEALRKSENYIPELSIVAKVDNKIVGYILCTEVNIINGEDTNKALAIAPFAVLPEYRNEKIGSKMIKRAFTKANKLGYKGIVVLGYKNIFEKYGFKPAWIYDVKAPFDVPEDNYMVKDIKKGYFDNVKGIVEYAEAFKNF